MATSAALQKTQKIVPAFVVTELTGKRKRIIKKFNKTKKTFEDHEVEIEGGFLLKFPKGHSIVVDTREEVERLVGDPERVELVDLETSDVHAIANIPLAKGDK